jgi:integrase
MPQVPDWPDVFYRHVCNREVKDRFGLPAWRGEKKLPTVLSIEQVTRLLSCVKNLKHRVLLKTIYSGGLRVSEAVRLKPHHIESDPSRMLIRVDQGKGKKDRYTVLSVALLKELRLYWEKYRPEKWLFPGNGVGKHLCCVAAQRVFYNAKKKPAVSTASVTPLQPTRFTEERTFIRSVNSSVIHP